MFIILQINNYICLSTNIVKYDHVITIRKFLWCYMKKDIKKLSSLTTENKKLLKNNFLFIERGH